MKTVALNGKQPPQLKAQNEDAYWFFFPDTRAILQAALDYEKTRRGIPRPPPLRPSRDAIALRHSSALKTGSDDARPSRLLRSH